MCESGHSTPAWRREAHEALRRLEDALVHQERELLAADGHDGPALDLLRSSHGILVEEIVRLRLLLAA
jgi:hypothetical protein